MWVKLSDGRYTAVSAVALLWSLICADQYHPETLKAATTDLDEKTRKRRHLIIPTQRTGMNEGRTACIVRYDIEQLARIETLPF
jgi:hypothetical protein